MVGNKLEDNSKKDCCSDGSSGGQCVAFFFYMFFFLLKVKALMEKLVEVLMHKLNEEQMIEILQRSFSGSTSCRKRSSCKKQS